jgi:hypothetical protein
VPAAGVPGTGAGGQNEEVALAPIEVFFGAILLIFTLIGLARGFLKELGVTLPIIFLLFFLNQFSRQLDVGLAKALDVGTSVLPAARKDLMQCWLYIFLLTAAAFVSYQGETLAFGGQSPKGPQAVLLGALTGLLNGYLVVGSIWYYMDKFDYPITFLGFSADRLSHFATSLISFLPLNFLGEPILLGQSLLLYLSALLLLARVIR